MLECLSPEDWFWSLLDICGDFLAAHAQHLAFFKISVMYAEFSVQVPLDPKECWSACLLYCLVHMAIA